MNKNFIKEAFQYTYNNLIILLKKDTYQWGIDKNTAKLKSYEMTAVSKKVRLQI